MTESEKMLINNKDYDFLRTHPRLGGNIILLGLGGSKSYGTNNANSDTDIRGIAMPLKSDIFGCTNFEQVIDNQTDTVIYSLSKIIELFSNCNPNTIELLGLRDEDYFYISPEGQLLLDNKDLFLSKRCAHAFGGYANAQLRRLQNALARDFMTNDEREWHIYNSCVNAFNNQKLHDDDKWNDWGNIDIRIGKSTIEGQDTEILVDCNVSDMPLRAFKDYFNVMNDVVSSYDKIGKRNNKKDDLHLNKHAMHLIRLYLMGLDILEKGEINTYRSNEHDLLMDIRNGVYQKDDKNFTNEFYELIDYLGYRFNVAVDKSELPNNPDYNKIGKLKENLLESWFYKAR